MKKIGILHPGEMGISVAASAMNSEHQVYWVSTGRSEQTRQRAEKQNLVELQSLSEFCQICEIILSICPPHAAEEVARSVITEKYKGIYVDANAISPQRVKRLHQIMEENGIHFIDGSIIGGPAWKSNETFLYLSGKGTEVISGCFLSGPLETRIIVGEVGKASALKMCYAAYSKGTTALLASILATAEAFDIRDDLYRQWDLDDPGFSEQVNRRVIRTSPKAWRFTSEMKEIGATFENAGLPSGFHEAAADVYRRMTNLKNMPAVTLEEIITAITHQSH
jgi:3-hydroxyisobutyrate dehydrogenase-like beta-hydroxyacid dehydrogenase